MMVAFELCHSQAERKITIARHVTKNLEALAILDLCALEDKNRTVQITDSLGQMTFFCAGFGLKWR